MPITTCTFRVFVSSTFDDLKEERDALQRDVFPKLRKLCEEHGARFQAIDLRWGIRHEAALDQRTMDICLREIERCQATGVKPNFIVLLGDRYGWQPVPSRIAASELDPRPIAGDWYQLDQNADPPEYVLRPRTGPFADPDHWSEEEERLRSGLEQSARAAGIMGNALSKYTESATHQEIRAGLGRSEEDRSHVFGFFREKSGETDARLEEVKALITNRTEFPRGNLTKLCNDVYNALSEAIRVQVDRLRNNAATDPQDTFAEERSRVFKGHDQELAYIAAYLTDGERRPLVLYGPSGSGKSALMAKASLGYRGPARVLRRFIGASTAAFDGHSLLSGLCHELDPRAETPVDFAELADSFRERLEKAGAAGPVILFIDALNQLAADDRGRGLYWLPRELPVDVKIVVSATATSEDELPPGMRLAIGELTPKEAGEALDAWLMAPRSRRQLRGWQRAKVLEAFGRCRLPLYLKMAAEECRLWPSYATDPECSLGEGVAGIIDTLLKRLASNANHGPVLVDRSLGYLAASRYGLAEDELLDVLSADEIVWNDFNQRKHHDLSERRLPVVVWSRLSLDLEPYLTEQVGLGGTLLTFYHRQLAERVTDRFPSEGQPTASQSVFGRHSAHLALATYFRQRGDPQKNHTWRGGTLRGLSEYPYHACAAESFVELTRVICSFDFLSVKIPRLGLRSVLEDHDRALRSAAPPALATDLIVWSGFLRGHAHVLRRGCDAWPADRILLQLALENADSEQVAQAAAAFLATGIPDYPRLLRSGKPRTLSHGSSILFLEGHEGMVHGAMELSRERLLTWSSSGPLRIWNTRSGESERLMGGHTDGVWEVKRISDGTLISVSADGSIRQWNSETGRCLAVMRGHHKSLHTVEEILPGRLVSRSLDESTLEAWDVATGRLMQTLDLGRWGRSSFSALCDGMVLTYLSAPDAPIQPGWSIWNTSQDGQLVRLEPQPTWAPLLLNDGMLFGFTDEGSSVAKWMLSTGTSFLKRPAEGRGGRPQFQLSNRVVIEQVEDRGVELWDATTGTFLLQLGQGDIRSTSKVTEDRIVTVSRKSVQIWQASSGRCEAEFVGDKELGFRASVLPNGWILTHDSKGRLWNWQENELVWSGDESFKLLLRGERILVERSGLASGTRNDHTVVIDLHSGKSVNEIEDTDINDHTPLELRDGRIVVATSTGPTLRIWDPNRRGESAERIGHTGPVGGVRSLPSGLVVSWAREDAAIMVWNPDDGRRKKVLEPRYRRVGGRAGIIRLAKERVLAVSDEEPVADLFDVSLGKWLGQAWSISPGQGIRSAAERPGGLIVLWFDDEELGSWRPDEGRGVQKVPENRASKYYQSLSFRDRVRREKDDPEEISNSPYGNVKALLSTLTVTGGPVDLVQWHSDGEFLSVHEVRPDGLIIASLDSGELVFLRPQRGNRPLKLSQ